MLSRLSLALRRVKRCFFSDGLNWLAGPRVHRLHDGNRVRRLENDILLVVVHVFPDLRKGESNPCSLSTPVVPATVLMMYGGVPGKQ